MYKRYFLIVFMTAMLIAGCSKQDSVSYLDQKTPGMTPEMFAPGIVSSPDFREYSGTFSPDFKEYYFYRFAENASARIYCTKFVDGQWTAPAPVSFSEGYPAFEPYIPFGNRTLYFGWLHPRPEGQFGDPQMPGMWAVDRTAEGWSEPRYAGNGMWISSSRNGRMFITDLYRFSGGWLAEFTEKDGRLSNFTKVTGGMDRLTGIEGMAHPCIAPDESFLIFDVNSGCYLFVCFKQKDGTWGEAIDLTKNGFDPMAGGASVSPDGKFLFFGLKGDIWWVDVKAVTNLKTQE